MHSIEPIMDSAQARKKDKQIGQASMFDLMEDGGDGIELAASAIPEWSDHERLSYEKEILGFYITGHPLVQYKKDLAWFADCDSATLPEKSHGQKVHLGGVPLKIMEKTTKKGGKMAFVTLEDLQGTFEVTVWPETYKEAQALLKAEVPVLVKGDAEVDENSAKVIAQQIYPLADAKKHWQGKIHISFRTPGLERETLLAVKNVLAANKGGNEPLLYFIFPNGKSHVVSVAPELRVQPSDSMVQEIETLLGDNSIRFE
jgi:DNA polymerase-3 subunit alpha